MLIIPVLIGLYCYYFYLASQEDSSVQKPEKLYKEKGLMVYCLMIVVLFVILMFVDIPFLSSLTNSSLIFF